VSWIDRDARPPELHLQLVRDPQRWFDAVSLTLLAELRRRAPDAINWAEMSNIVPLIDAFEAAHDGRPVRRH
jgi:hypothetical protein